MTKQLASEIADSFNSLVKSYRAEVSNVNAHYSVSIHCDTFISSSLLARVEQIASKFDVLPYIDCFDNDMVIEICC